MRNEHVGHCHSHEHHHCQDHHHAFLMREDVIEKLERLLSFSETLKSIDERVGQNYTAIQNSNTQVRESLRLIKGDLSDMDTEIQELKEGISSLSGMKPIEITEEDIDNEKHFVWNGEPFKYSGMISVHSRVVYANGVCNLYVCFAHDEDGGLLFLHCSADTDGLDGKFHVVDYHLNDPYIARYFSEAVATELYDGLMSKEDKQKLKDAGSDIIALQDSNTQVRESLRLIKGDLSDTDTKIRELKEGISSLSGMKPIEITEEDFANEKHFVWNGEPFKYSGMISVHSRVVYANGVCNLYVCFAHNEDGGLLFLHCSADTDGLDGKFHVVDYHLNEPYIAHYFSEAVATEQYDGLMSKEDKKKLNALNKGTLGEVTDEAEENNNNPISSKGVYKIIGDINSILTTL